MKGYFYSDYFYYRKMGIKTDNSGWLNRELKTA